QKEISIRDSLLQQVRSGQFKTDVARVVLDMNSVYDYQISARNDPDRIIIDVQGNQPKVQPLPTTTVQKKTDEELAAATPEPKEPTPEAPSFSPQYSGSATSS